MLDVGLQTCREQSPFVGHRKAQLNRAFLYLNFYATLFSAYHDRQATGHSPYGWLPSLPRELKNTEASQMTKTQYETISQQSISFYNLNQVSN